MFEQAGQLDRACRIERPGTLRELVDTSDRDRGVLKNRLDRIRRKRDVR